MTRIRIVTNWHILQSQHTFISELQLNSFFKAAQINVHVKHTGGDVDLMDK